MRISTTCSKERAPKQVQCECIADGSHKEPWTIQQQFQQFLKFRKKIQKTGLAKQILKNQIFDNVLFFKIIFNVFCLWCVVWFFWVFIVFVICMYFWCTTIKNMKYKKNNNKICEIAKIQQYGSCKRKFSIVIYI